MTTNPEDEIKILEEMNEIPDREKIEEFYRREDVKARIEEDKKEKELEEKTKEDETINRVSNDNPVMEGPSDLLSRFKISAGPVGYFPMGRYRMVLSPGYGLAACADVRMIDIIFNIKSPFIPELTGEFSYLRFEKDKVGFNGYLMAAGPVWTVNVTSQVKFYGAFLIGEGYLDFENEKIGYAEKAMKNVMLATVGFSFELGPVELTPRVRYLFIDDTIPFHGLGFGIFTSYMSF